MPGPHPPHPHDHATPHDHDHDHDHDHGHDHGHGPHVHVRPGSDPHRALSLALVLNGAFLVVEIVVGFWTDSLAVLSDAAHMVSDVASLVVALGALRLARRRGARDQTFGLHRFETLGAFVNGLGVFVVVAFLLKEAVERLLGAPPDVAGTPVIVVGVIGLAINLWSAAALWRSDRDNLNIRAALVHMLADAIGSVGAILAGALLNFGYASADPAVSIALAVLVAWGAWGVTRDAGRVLLQLPPPGFDVEALLRELLGLTGVVAVHDLHVWTLDGREPIVTAHLVAAAPIDALALSGAATRHVADLHGVDHATFQVEIDDDPCPRGDCGATGRSDDARDPTAR